MTLQAMLEKGDRAAYGSLFAGGMIGARSSGPEEIAETILEPIRRDRPYRGLSDLPDRDVTLPLPPELKCSHEKDHAPRRAFHAAELSNPR